MSRSRGKDGSGGKNSKNERGEEVKGGRKGGREGGPIVEYWNKDEGFYV